jgi:hypothetical protein
VRAASWFHDGSVPGPAKTGYGNNWVIAAVVVRLPAVRRPVAIPVLAKLEIAIEDAKQVFGTGQARNRTARAVERTIPFQIACQAITTCWYATAGHDPADIAGHRDRAPWYTTKTQPSTADMAAKLRRVVIAARFKASRPDQPTPEEISTLRLAWEDLAA